jgi:[acyl-carrier-protein] S-malonyltransferase
MKKVNLLFPGQGSQYIGMNKRFKDIPECWDVFKKADEALGFKLSELCLTGDESELRLTQNTQPAIVATSTAYHLYLKKLIGDQIEINTVLGHSVGEYSALVASGSLKLEDAVLAVRERGRHMQNSTPVGVGSMYAIIRVPSDQVETACKAVSNSESQVMPANFNEPTQTVISGHSDACQRAVDWLKENYEGKFLAKELKVSAPFHSSLMSPAQSEMKKVLAEIEINSNEINYIANIDAKVYERGTDPEMIRENLIKQISGSVHWYKSFYNLAEDQKYIEVGAGKVLTGLNKKINSHFQTFNMDNDDVEKTIQGFLDEPYTE